MINFERIASIQTRINEIEKMVRVRPELPGADFQKSLRKEIERMQNAGKTAMDQGSAGNRTASGAANSMPVTAGRVNTAGGTAESRTSTGALSGDQAFSDMIVTAAQKYQVDPKLVSAVAEAESGGDQSAVSAAGAVGVMQLMPDTAAALGVDPYDKKQNIEGGAKYLKQMLDSFGGDVRKAVAAYNAGPQAVRDYGGVPPYAETQDYVEHVLDLYQ